MKINFKLGGVNYVIDLLEKLFVFREFVIIFGVDVIYFFFGENGILFIVVVVVSMDVNVIKYCVWVWV